MTRIVAGCICLSLGLIFWVGYDPEDYRGESSYAAATLEDSVRIQRENVDKRRERDSHRITIAVSIGLGSLMILDDSWRRRRRASRQEQTPEEEP